MDRLDTMATSCHVVATGSPDHLERAWKKEDFARVPPAGGSKQSGA
jgi:hypothetical protein